VVFRTIIKHERILIVMMKVSGKKVQRFTVQGSTLNIGLSRTEEQNGERQHHPILRWRLCHNSNREKSLSYRKIIPAWNRKKAPSITMIKP
jgi:hypothetical protein